MPTLKSMLNDGELNAVNLKMNVRWRQRMLFSCQHYKCQSKQLHPYRSVLWAIGVTHIKYYIYQFSYIMLGLSVCTIKNGFRMKWPNWRAKVWNILLKKKEFSMSGWKILNSTFFTIHYIFLVKRRSLNIICIE